MGVDLVQENQNLKVLQGKKTSHTVNRKKVNKVETLPYLFVFDFGQFNSVLNGLITPKLVNFGLIKIRLCQHTICHMIKFF